MKKTKDSAVVINVSGDEREKVNELARKRGYKITSDYLRMLISEDAKKHNLNVDFDVNRGGWRGESA